MRNRLRAVVGMLNKAYTFGALFFLVIVICSCAVQVFTRYVLNNSLTGTEEISSYGFMWMTMLGISICTSNDSHSVVGILNDALKGKWKTGHKLLVYFAMMFGMILMMVQGIRMMDVAQHQLSPVLRLPMHVIYLSIPIGCFGVMVNLAVHMLDGIAEIAKVRRATF